MLNKQIGIVGTFIRDRIVPLTGNPIECIGGLYHSVAYASLLAGERFEIMPVARVGRDYFERVQQHLIDFPGVDLSYLRKYEKKNTAVTLTYRTATERNEVLTGLMPPLNRFDAQGLKNATGILVNMITGYDIELDALRWLSKHTEAPIHLDIHSFALGIDRNGKRFYRQPLSWHEWFEAADFIQMNENEAACLCEKNDVQSLQTFMAEMLNRHKLTGIMVTLGADGVMAFTKEGDSKPVVKKIPVEADNITVQDVIGCGDAFGAAFFVNYLRTRNFWQAVQLANRVAAWNATFMGSITRERYETYF